jgi:conjugative transfer signal peptidase TraF
LPPPVTIERTIAPSPPRRRPPVLTTVLAALVATALVTSAACALASHLLVNVTRSMPLGLYWMRFDASVGPNDLVAFPVPPPVHDLVRDRRYLMDGARLLKPVAAVAGDRVCIEADTVRINGRLAAHQRATDSDGRPVPRDSRCESLPPGFVYLLASDPRSFDSRVFGPVDVHHLAAKVTPLWTF